MNWSKHTSIWSWVEVRIRSEGPLRALFSLKVKAGIDPVWVLGHIFTHKKKHYGHVFSGCVLGRFYFLLNLWKCTLHIFWTWRTAKCGQEHGLLYAWLLCVANNAYWVPHDSSEYLQSPWSPCHNCDTKNHSAIVQCQVSSEQCIVGNVYTEHTIWRMQPDPYQDIREQRVTQILSQ